MIDYSIWTLKTTGGRGVDTRQLLHKPYPQSNRYAESTIGIKMFTCTGWNPQLLSSFLQFCPVSGETGTSCTLPAVVPTLQLWHSVPQLSPWSWPHVKSTTLVTVNISAQSKTDVDWNSSNTSISIFFCQTSRVPTVCPACSEHIKGSHFAACDYALRLAAAMLECLFALCTVTRAVTTEMVFKIKIQD